MCTWSEHRGVHDHGGREEERGEWSVLAGQWALASERVLDVEEASRIAGVC